MTAVTVGDWIRIGPRDCLVMGVYTDWIAVGYVDPIRKNQAVKDEAIWDGATWTFRDKWGDRQLQDSEAAAVLQGPPKPRPA